MPVRSPRIRRVLAGTAVLACAAVAAPSALHAQDGTPAWTPDHPGSANMQVLGHLPLGARLSVADMEWSRRCRRPYAYVARMVYGDEGPKGTDIVNIADPDQAEGHLPLAHREPGPAPAHRRHGREALQARRTATTWCSPSQFGQGGPDNDLGAVVLDVTGLPDPQR